MSGTRQWDVFLPWWSPGFTWEFCDGRNNWLCNRFHLDRIRISCQVHLLERKVDSTQDGKIITEQVLWKILYNNYCSCSLETIMLSEDIWRRRAIQWYAMGGSGLWAMLVWSRRWNFHTLFVLRCLEKTHHQWNGLKDLLNTPWETPDFWSITGWSILPSITDKPAIFWKHPIFRKRSHLATSGESLRPISSEHLGKLRGLDELSGRQLDLSRVPNQQPTRSASAGGGPRLCGLWRRFAWDTGLCPLALMPWSFFLELHLASMGTEPPNELCFSFFGRWTFREIIEVGGQKTSTTPMPRMVMMN